MRLILCPLPALLMRNISVSMAGLQTSLKQYDISKINKVDEIQKIERRMEIPLTGPYCDFIWSDPTTTPSGKIKGKSTFNDSR